MRLKITLLNVITALAVAALLAAAGCDKANKPARPAGQKVRVVATLFPIADVARQIGGDDADVQPLLKPGQEPHEFEPSAEQTEMVGQSDLLIMVGMGIDEWAERSAKVAGKNTKVLVLTGGDFARMLTGDCGSPANVPSTARQDGAAAAGCRHDHGGDPHVWLDPVFMQTFAAKIADSLSQLDPAHSQQYMHRRDRYIDELKKLDQQYRDELSPLKRKQFVIFHESFGYVARRYGLQMMALQNADAADFGTQRIEQVTEFVRKNNVRAIFAEPQFPADRLQAIASLTGAKIGVLDDMGNPSVKGYDSYLAMMRSNLAALVAGLKD